MDAFLDHPWRPHWDRHPPPGESPLECVLIEPRPHPNLPKVLANVSCVLPYASLTILHSKENAAQIDAMCLPPSVTRRCILPAKMTVADYNRLLCNPFFWADLHGDHILVFQTDTGLRVNRILRFLEYDYVGAPWTWSPFPQYPHIHVGNGGLSLRCRARMQDICLDHLPDPAYALRGYEHLGEPEDLYFSRHLHQHGAALPDPDIATQFSVEYTYHPDPMGFHKAYEFHPSHIVKAWFAAAALDLPRQELLDITDAWYEGSHGKTHTPSCLVAHLRLGISARGWRLPQCSSLPFATGYNTLHVTFSNGTRLDEIQIGPDGRAAQETSILSA